MLGFKKPEFIKGVPQKPLEGISFTNSFESADAPAKKTVQHFEIYGNRSIYKDGWKAVVNHTFSKSYADDVWELYHVEEDYSEKYNVADKYPEKLRELQDEWLIQAAKYHVFPMPPNGQHAYRKQLQDTYGFMMVRPAQTFVYENVILPHDLSQSPAILNATHTVIANINRNSCDKEGVIFSKGDRFAGVSFYIKDNKLKYVYNADQDQVFIAESERTLPKGEVEVKYTFTLTGEEEAEAEVILYINNEKVGSTKVTHFIYTLSEVATLKADKYTSVHGEDYESPFEFEGDIKKIVFDVAAIGIDPKREVERGMHKD